MKMPGADVECPACGEVFTLPLTVKPAAIHLVGHQTLNVSIEDSATQPILDHIAGHLSGGPDGDGGLPIPAVA